MSGKRKEMFRVVHRGGKEKRGTYLREEKDLFCRIAVQ